MSGGHTSDVVGLVRGLIQRALAAGASDVHIDGVAGAGVVRQRIDGELREVERLPGAILPNVVARLKVLGGLLTYQCDLPQEGTIAGTAEGLESDIRVATFPTVEGERVVLRLLANARRLLSLEDLGHAPETVARLAALLRQPQGLLLVVGPAGSGKTTTAAALLTRLARERPGVSVISVEDPVELRLPGVTQVQLSAARGLTCAVALRSLLRQDPQVLFVGEVRDAEVARMVVSAALSGHLIVSTLHAGTPAEAIVRLREMGVAPYQLTSALRAVLSQRLLRRSGDTQAARGRVAIGHLVTMNDALAAAILADADRRRLERADGCPGGLRADAARLIADGAVAADEVERCLGAEFGL